MFDINNLNNMEMMFKQNLKCIEENEFENRVLSTRTTYSDSLMECKIQKDARFLMSLKDKYIGIPLEEADSTDKKIKLSEDAKDWDKLFESVLVNTFDLFKEINENATQSSYYAQTVFREDNIFESISSDVSLTEAEEVNLYMNNLLKNIEVSFIKPIEENTFYNVNKDKVKLIVETMANKVSSNIDSLDTELLTKYAIFENIIINEIVKVLVPDDIQQKVSDFNQLNENTNPEYFELFDKNSKNLMENIQVKADCMGQLIAPKMFAIGFGEININPESFRGTSKIINESEYLKNYRNDEPSSIDKDEINESTNKENDDNATSDDNADDNNVASDDNADDNNVASDDNADDNNVAKVIAGVGGLGLAVAAGTVVKKELDKKKENKAKKEKK